MAIKMASHLKTYLNLDLQFMNLSGLVMPDSIFKFFRHCLNDEESWFGAKLFSDFLINQSLCSEVFLESFVVSGEFHGFSCILTEMGMKNYDLVLNYTFRKVQAVKKHCLTNSSMYDEFYASHIEEFNHQVSWNVSNFLYISKHLTKIFLLVNN